MSLVLVGFFLVSIKKTNRIGPRKKWTEHIHTHTHQQQIEKQSSTANIAETSGKLMEERRSTERLLWILWSRIWAFDSIEALQSHISSVWNDGKIIRCILVGFASTLELRKQNLTHSHTNSTILWFPSNSIDDDRLLLLVFLRCTQIRQRIFTQLDYGKCTYTHTHTQTICVMLRKDATAVSFIQAPHKN